MAHADELLVPSGIIAVVGFALHYATASTFARKSGSLVDVSQEMVALGFANLVGGVFLARPLAPHCGSPPRTPPRTHFARTSHPAVLLKYSMSSYQISGAETV